jgi:hypothetical protein
VNENGGEEVTKAGNLKLPPYDTLIDWILQGILEVTQKSSDHHLISVANN